MTTRDPGTPRRNPFFEHDSDGTDDDPGMGWRDAADGAATSGFVTLMGLVEGLADAQPEAAEHLVAAAHEVVLTVKVLVDATEAVLADQRSAMAERREAREADDPTGQEDGVVTDLGAVADTGRVRPHGEP